MKDFSDMTFREKIEAVKKEATLKGMEIGSLGGREAVYSYNKWKEKIKGKWKKIRSLITLKKG